MTKTDTDILIIGAGLAGLFLALKLAPRPCIVMSPAPLGTAASSSWAQGGLAAALHPADSPGEHAADTLAVGAGLVEPTIARLIAEDGPARVRDLLSLGVPFDRTEDGALALSLEAAHSHPRVARVAGDLAGKAIMEALIAATENADHIKVVDHIKAISLLQDSDGRIGGVLTRDLESQNNIDCPLTARETILCSGGSGGLYRVTTNPKTSRGDAIAMVYECGGVIADPEFVQFHPTAIDIDRDPAPLATEALRGEGAILRDANGRAFMSDYHSQGELAPRDEVARAIHSERMQGRFTYLDATQAIGEEFPTHFPTVFQACRAAGLDPRLQYIPVAPAAHYHMGGVACDMWGRTSLEGLSVCGESASTGAHGGNRLASNSLLEAVVFAERIANRLRNADLTNPGGGDAQAPVDLQPERLLVLRKLMGDHAGVVRNATGLKELIGWIEDSESLRGPARAITVARLLARSALARCESRGGHYRSDFPETSPVARRTFVRLGEDRMPVIEHLPLIAEPEVAA